MRLEGADRALPTQVTVGSTRNGTVEITDGKLLPGDKILVQGAADITSEQRVQIVEDKPDQGAAPADGKAGPDTKSSSPDAKGSAPGGPKKS